MAIKEWTTSYPASQDSSPPTTEQPDLTDLVDDHRSSHVEAVRDKLDAAAKFLGDDSNLPAGSLHEIIDLDHTNGSAKMVRFYERSAKPTLSANEAAIYAKDDSGTVKVYVEWDDGTETLVGSGGGSSPLTTKGDVYTYSTVDARLAVGTNGQVLTADSTESTGLKWDDAGSASTLPGSADDLDADVTSNISVNSVGTPVQIYPGSGSGSFTADTAGLYRISLSFLGLVQYAASASNWYFKVVLDEGEGTEVVVGDGEVWGFRDASAQTNDYQRFSFEAIATLTARTYTVKAYGELQDSGGNVLIPDQGGRPQVQIHSIGGTGGYGTVEEQATTPKSLVASDAGVAWTNEGSASQVVFNLPTAVAGLRYSFITQDSNGIKINAAAGDTIRIAGSVSAAAGFISNTTVGNTATLVAVNATEWIAISHEGTWTVT